MALYSPRSHQQIQINQILVIVCLSFGRIFTNSYFLIAQIAIIYYNCMISSLRALSSSAFRQMQRPCVFSFGKDNWKERDEASEKVYISQSEKQTIKRLLKKVQAEEEDRESNLQQFERKLSQIMRRYKLDNEALASEIVQLHKNLQ